MKKFVIIAALAGLLVGCAEGRKERIAEAESKATLILTGEGRGGGDIIKFCDSGRAIYAVDYQGGAMWGVDNAPECKGR